MDLNSFDGFVHQVSHPEGDCVGPPTPFFQGCALDEPSGSIPSFSVIFERRVGRLLEGYLELFP